MKMRQQYTCSDLNDLDIISAFTMKTNLLSKIRIETQIMTQNVNLFNYLSPTVLIPEFTYHTYLLRWGGEGE